MYRVYVMALGLEKDFTLVQEQHESFIPAIKSALEHKVKRSNMRRPTFVMVKCGERIAYITSRLIKV